MKTREKVKNMFRDLRKEGFFARMNFWCCRSCAWSAIGQKEKKEGKEINNVIFFSEQNNIDSGKVWVSWCGDAKKIFEMAEKHNLYMVWNGEEDRSILLVDAEVTYDQN